MRQRIWEWLSRAESQKNFALKDSAPSDSANLLSRARVQSEAGRFGGDFQVHKSNLPEVIDFRKMGGDSLIPIAIFERYGNHVYEDLILWSINGK